MVDWWRKIFRSRGRNPDSFSEEPYIDVSSEPEEESAMETKDEPRRGGWLTRWRAPKKQEKQLATLQEGFSELVGLTRSIREHMDQQSHTQEALLEMLQHVPGAVEGMKNVGRATEQQTETLGLIKKQLEASARTESHLADSMSGFNKTLSLMDEMSKSTSRTVSTMADRTRDSEETLRIILERSERRLVYMIGALIVVTLTVLGAGLYIGLGQRGTEEAMTPVETAPPGAMAPVDEPATEEEPAEIFERERSIAELGDPESEPELEPEEDVEPPAADDVEEDAVELDDVEAEDPESDAGDDERSDDLDEAMQDAADAEDAAEEAGDVDEVAPVEEDE